MKEVFIRFFVVLTVITLIIVLILPFFLLLLFVSIGFKSQPIFRQSRIGKNAIPFTIYKLRTIHSNTKRISLFGHFLRTYKLDEIPQLFNILKGDMTFVGPRPDVSGYADKLQGEDRIVLSVLPGLTGLASLKYRNEEALLALQNDSIAYNDSVIWPDKVRINKWYVQNRTLKLDLKIIFHTIFSVKWEEDRWM